MRSHRRLLSRNRGAAGISRTVVALGAVSLLTDISAEMVATVLPLYLVAVLGFSPLQYGIVDGLYQGAAALVRLAGGFVGDRTRNHKAVASVGYALSAACKLALVVVGTAFSAISAVVLLDRVGKGIRTAPRDAMISLSTRPEHQGAAFGVHRAMDTTGALLGPLLAFGLLALLPLAFDVVFLVAFFIALAGLAVLMLLVERPAKPQDAESRAAVSLREAAGLLRDRRVLAMSAAAFALGLATISDGFIYLAQQRRLDIDPRYFPLFFIGTAVVFMVLAAPMGRLADRAGRPKVLVGGYLALAAAYVSLLLPAAGVFGLVACLALLGVYYAATDGVLMALAGAVVAPELRGSGLALVGTATSLARLVGSISFGALWMTAGLATATACFLAGLVVAMAATAWLLGRRPAHA